VDDQNYDCPKNSSFVNNLAAIRATVPADQHTFLTKSRSLLLRMRNVLDKSCKENQNTFYVQYNFFFNRVVYEITRK